MLDKAGAGPGGATLERHRASTRQKLVVVAILTIFLAGMFALSQFVAGVWERPSPPHHTPRAGDRGQVDMWGDAASEDESNATAAKQELDRLTHNQSASLISIIEDKLKHDIRNAHAPAAKCAKGQMLDCGNQCVPRSWVGDKYCDDPDPSGKFSLHCAAAKWDGGDCSLKRCQYPRSCGMAIVRVNQVCTHDEMAEEVQQLFSGKRIKQQCVKDCQDLVTRMYRTCQTGVAKCWNHDIAGITKKVKKLGCKPGTKTVAGEPTLDELIGKKGLHRTIFHMFG